MEHSQRVEELNKQYGWNLILKSLCKSVLDMDRILNMEFGTVITYLELGKVEQEIEHIYNEQFKNKMKK